MTEFDGKTTINISKVTRLNWILEKLEDVICNLIEEQIMYKWVSDSNNYHNHRW